jgi:hypothetical protein
MVCCWEWPKAQEPPQHAGAPGRETTNWLGAAAQGQPMGGSVKEDASRSCVFCHLLPLAVLLLLPA